MSTRQHIVWTGCSVLLILPIGFYSKFYHGPAHNWVNNSLGGVFYVIFWCLIIYFIRPKWRPISIALGIGAATSLLEVLQLWHPSFLELIRSNFIGRTILGTSFAWHDFPYYFVGSLIGWGWLNLLRKRCFSE